MSLFESDTIDTLISKIMLYLNEILVIFGLILLLILLVRISLWLLHCNLCSKSSDHLDPESGNVESGHNHNDNDEDDDMKKSSIDNDNEEKNLEKSKRKQKVNEEIPPPPVPKPDFLKDENHHSDQQLNSVNLPSPLESDRPEFRIVSESQLPKPDETQSIPEIKTEEIPVNEESDKTETESEAIMADVIIKSLINVDNVDEKINEQQDQESSHTYAQILRSKNIVENNSDDQQQANNDNDEKEVETNDSNKKTPEYTVVDIVVRKKSLPIEQDQQEKVQMNIECEQKPKIVDETQYEKIEIEQIEMIEKEANLMEKESQKPDEQQSSTMAIESKQLETKIDDKSESQIVKRIPAHRCICPYCSSNNSTRNRLSSMLNNEESEVLKRLDETLEEMERLNESLAPLTRQQNDDEDYTLELESELLKIAQEIHERQQQQRKEQHNIENKDNDHQSQQQQKQSNNVEPEKSNNDCPLQLQSADNNNGHILEPKQLDAYSTLIRNRIRIYEPEHPYHPRIVPNWIPMKLRQKLNLLQTATSSPPLSSSSSISNEPNRPELPPKPIIIETIAKKQPMSATQMNGKIQSKQKPEHNRIIDRRRAFTNNDDDDDDDENEDGNEDEDDDNQEPQCAIYAKVIDQIKQRGNLNYHNHHHHNNNHDHQNHQQLMLQQK
uniref:Myb-like protein AA n=1 Tax=Dermatophagoides pteronyssinus TaxID=6956 RepID=A0A6P6YJC1_DERPT|nr:myb-like protein AA [Dermatophagoides pteronyssinus]